MMPILVRRYLLAFTLVLAACATTAPPPARLAITPSSAPATLYESDGPREPELERSLNLSARGLRSDSRLSALAAFVAHFWRTHHTTPSHQVLDFVAHHLGLPEPAPHLALLGAPGDELDARIASELDQLSRRSSYTHVGLFVDRASESGLAVLVLSFRQLNLAAVPRRLAAPAPITLRGELWEGYASPTLVVVQPSGALRRTALGGGRHFTTEILPEGPGVLRVELLSDGPLGTAVVANFPIYVGIEPPLTISVDTQKAREGRVELDPAQELLDLLNRARAQARQPALARDAALDAVAQAHNEDMIAHAFVGHTSSQTGNAVDRVSRSGLPTSLVLENIGRDDSASAIHDGWMGSPGHRENLLHPQATHVGIAASIQPALDDGQSTILATQVFIRRTPPLAEDAAAQLLAEINRLRSASGSPPLTLDETLSDLCQATAARHFAQPQVPVSQNLADLQRAQRDAGTGYERLATTIIVTTVVEEVAGEPQLSVSDAKAIGIGIAQGTRAESEPNAIAVVLSLAY